MSVAFDYHFVLFLDILGYSAAIARATTRAAGPVSDLDNIRQAFVEAQARYAELPGYDVRQFSDSVILSKSFADVSGVDFLLECARLQHLMLRHGILTRGGVTVGKHYSEKDFVASQGVIDAYQLEQNIAKYPRVVVSEELLGLCFPSNDYSGVPVVRQSDGCVFIDYLGDVSAIEEMRILILSLWSAGEALAWSAKEKLQWLVDYWNWANPEQIIGTPEVFERIG